MDQQDSSTYAQSSATIVEKGDTSNGTVPNPKWVPDILNVEEDHSDGATL